MNVMRILLVGAISSLIAFSHAFAEQQPTSRSTNESRVVPEGVTTQMSIYGPVFADARGMTLYTSRNTSRKKTIWPCDNTRYTTRAMHGSNVERQVDFTVQLPDLDTRRTCAEKHPPFLAPAAAKPVGKWAAIQRTDGSWQWAYDGYPLYTSIKDKLPGDVNADFRGGFDLFSFWQVALAPITGAPFGVTTERSRFGAVMVNGDGHTLYYRADSGPNGPACDYRYSNDWTPMVAPSAAVQLDGEWSIVTCSDGVKLWAYQDRILFSYKNDANQTRHATVKVYGTEFGPPIPGWQAVILHPAPAHPDEITVQFSPVGNAFDLYPEYVYADKRGHTLYTYHCTELADDQLECDDVGDSSNYWLSWCGGEDRCAETWRPIKAPAGVNPIGNIWSTAVIDPRNIVNPVTDSDAGGVRVWTYQGRPVLTYAGDKKPGDVNGTRLMARRNTITGPVWAFAGPDTFKTGETARRSPASVKASSLENKKTLGFVLARYPVARYETPDRREECPDGFLFNEEDNWNAQFPTQAERQAQLTKYQLSINRGPNGENVWNAPEVMEDPLPFREVQSKIAYGLDLDGVPNGQSSEKTCAHEDFISPDGREGIDNQLYRFLGCMRGEDRQLTPDFFIEKRLIEQPGMRMLLEVSDVDDEFNDDSVRVSLYRNDKNDGVLGLDRDGEIRPWQSLRIADVYPDENYSYVTHGKIENGILITESFEESIDALKSFHFLDTQGVRLRIKLTPNGAEGILGGYRDVNEYWEWVASYSIGEVGSSYLSGPSSFAALKRFADGDKDPVTGQCRSISAALQVEFKRAFLIHSDEGGEETAENTGFSGSAGEAL